jgi:mono/diheme cytochrome c family protein
MSGQEVLMTVRSSLRANAVRIAALACGFTLAAPLVSAQTGNGEKGAISFLEPRNPDPVLQHSKEIFVLNGCAYCHGVDLKVRNGEAADLMHSSIVAADVNGNLLMPLLRSGIPQTAKLSPMPQFSDLSDQELADIVRWIHYARQDGKYKELTSADAQQAAPGDSATGKAYFDKNCSSCHSKQSDLAGASAKFSGTLRLEILRPTALQGVQSWRIDQIQNTKISDARAQHQHLLENYSAPDVANLLAYLQSK